MVIGLLELNSKENFEEFKNLLLWDGSVVLGGNGKGIFCKYFCNWWYVFFFWNYRIYLFMNGGVVYCLSVFNSGWIKGGEWKIFDIILWVLLFMIFLGSVLLVVGK